MQFGTYLKLAGLGGGLCVTALSQLCQSPTPPWFNGGMAETSCSLVFPGLGAIGLLIVLASTVALVFSQGRSALRWLERADNGRAKVGTALLVLSAVLAIGSVASFAQGYRYIWGAPASTSAAAASKLPEPIKKYANSMKRYSGLPELELTHDQRLWLEQLYAGFQDGKKVVPYILVRRLAHQMSPDFDPKSVDQRLVSPQNEITLLGIWNVDQDTEWVGKVDLVLRYVKQIITSDPTVDHLSIADVATRLNLTPLDVSASLDLARSVGLSAVYRGAGGNYTDADYPRAYNTFDVGREDTFKLYEKYDGIEKAINTFGADNVSR